MLKLTAPIDADGALPEKDRKALRRELSRHCGKAVTIEIKRWVRPRSNQKNKAVMGFWMGVILDELGYFDYQKDDVYYHIKSLCWYDEKTKIPKPTKILDDAEYSKFMEIFRHCVHDTFGIWLQDPDRTMAMI